MTAFATYSDLAARLNRTFTGAEQTWVGVLLEDAAAFMRGEMSGNWVYPSRSSTYVAYPKAGRVTLPQPYVVSVDSVKNAAGVSVTYTRVDDTICVSSDAALTITFTYGLATAPADLVGINCAIAAQMMTTVTAGLGLNASGLSSVAIDDYKLAFADGGVGTGMTMTDTTRQYLNDRYGVTAWVVEATR